MAYDPTDPFAAIPTVAPPRVSRTFPYSDDDRKERPHRVIGGGGVGAFGPDQWQYSSGQPATAGDGDGFDPSAPPAPNPTPIPSDTPELDGGPDFDFEVPSGGGVTFDLPSGGTIGGPIPGGDLMARLRMFADQTLDDYNPYSTELVQEGMSLIDADLAEKRRQGVRDLGEFASQRGIVGSSIEQEQMGQLTSDLERERSRFAFDLHREQAMAEQQGRALAAQIAQGALGLETQRWQAQRSAELQARGLDIQEAQARATVELQNKANQLRELGLNQEAAFRQAAFELDEERFGFEQERWQDEFEQRERLAKMQIGAQTGAS